MKLHEKIRKLRKERGLSQAQMADLTSVHKAHFSRIERGKYKPSIELLKNIAQSLNVTTDYLLNEEVDSFTPVKIEDKTLSEKIRLIDSLEDNEKDALTKIIDALLTKKKFVDLVMKESGPAEKI